MTKHATGLELGMLEFIGSTDKDITAIQYREALENALSFFNVIGFEKGE